MAHKITAECTACGMCAEACPEEAISEGEIYVIDPNICTDCTACVDECPSDAIVEA